MSSPRTFWSVQYLRAIAAAGVVLAHAGDRIAGDHSGSGNALLDNGQAGVDIFFVISGFIIFFAGAERGLRPREFLARRLARVAPIYWLYTTAYIIGFLLVPTAYRELQLNGVHVIKSYLFIPALHPVMPMVYPVIPAAWTLNYEMFFYAVFALTLFVPGKRLLLITGVFVALTVAGTLAPGGSAIYRTYTNPVTLEFVAGCLLAAAVSRGWRLPGTVCAGLLIAAIAGFVLAAFAPEIERAIRWGIPATLLVSAAVFYEAANPFPRFAFWKKCGDASYSLYLTHLFTNGLAAHLLARLGLGSISDGLYVVLVLVIAQAIALLAHRWVERPLTRLASSPQSSIRAATLACRVGYESAQAILCANSTRVRAAHLGWPPAPLKGAPRPA